jgi:hypothetical protein
MYSISGDIYVLKFRWSAYGGTDWTGSIYLSSTCRFHQTRHEIQVNCTEKWVQFFRSSKNETSGDLVPHEKGTNIWGHMYEASIFWYSMPTWDHWEFKLWIATWHDSQQMELVQRVKAKIPSCFRFTDHQEHLADWHAAIDLCQKSPAEDHPCNREQIGPTDDSARCRRLWKDPSCNFWIHPIHNSSDICWRRILYRATTCL